MRESVRERVSGRVRKPLRTAKEPALVLEPFSKYDLETYKESDLETF